MFNDIRGKRVVLLAHCVLNQNSISDGTADYAGCNRDVMEQLLESEVGVIQMPCPELNCLGLDRGDTAGATHPVIEENTRIRGELIKESSMVVLRELVRQVVYQVEQYLKNGFEVLGAVGINRSPSCGVETTSKENREVEGEGVFVECLREELERKGVKIRLAGIKANEPATAVKVVRELVEGE